MPSIIQRIGRAFGKVERGNQELIKTGKLQSNVVPFSPAKGASFVTKIPSIAKTAFKYVTTAATKKAFNPMAGAKTPLEGIKQLGKSIATGTAAFGLGSIAYQGASSITSGNTPNAKDFSKNVIKSAAIGATTGVSSFPAFAGILKGTGTNVTDVAKDFYNKLTGRGQSMINDSANVWKNVKDNLPTDPRPTNININYPDWGQIGGTIPQTPTSFYFEQPALPQTPQANFNPSFSLGGGGMGDSLPLWLLAAGLGGGFLLGRKKRKKKKYKKRKRR